MCITNVSTNCKLPQASPPSPSSSATLTGETTRDNTPSPTYVTPSEGNMKDFRATTCVLSELEIKPSYQDNIYKNTRGVMRARTRGMFAHGLRDYQREHHAPMNHIDSALHLTRRYSLDINTGESGYEQPAEERVRDDKIAEIEEMMKQAASSCQFGTSFTDLDIMTTSKPFLHFPNPLRHSHLISRIARDPPHNDDRYLSFNDAFLTNNQYHYITTIQGDEAWMQDDCLDMALEILAHNKGCGTSTIAIASSIDSQIFFHASGQFGLEEYATKFQDKKWIFVPINDGVSGAVNNSTASNGIAGAHWSLLVLNHISKVVHYYDSFYINDPAHSELAEQVFLGLMAVLGEDGNKWLASSERNSPHQQQNNLCREDAFNACGPFVYTMIDGLVGEIQSKQRMGSEELSDLVLQDGFAERFGKWWNSYLIRCKMQESIAVVKMRLETEELAKLHDEAALGGQVEELLDAEQVDP